MLCDNGNLCTDHYLLVYNPHFVLFPAISISRKIKLLNCEFEAFKLQISLIWHNYLTHQSIKLHCAISKSKVSTVNLIFLLKEYRYFSNKEMSCTMIYCQHFPPILNHKKDCSGIPLVPVLSISIIIILPKQKLINTPIILFLIFLNYWG